MGIDGLQEIGFQTNIVILTGSIGNIAPGAVTASVRWSTNGAFTPLIINNRQSFAAGYIYPSAGTRTVTVRVCGSDGRCATDDITVRTGITQRISPRVCVVDRGVGQSLRYQANWSYTNPASFAVFAPTIPLLDNTFTTFPLLRGQPQVFAPGSHANVFSTMFSSGTSALTRRVVTAAPVSLR